MIKSNSSSRILSATLGWASLTFLIMLDGIPAAFKVSAVPSVAISLNPLIDRYRATSTTAG
jgi:hypothetical protein